MTNKVADALSRCHENNSDEDKELHAINVSEDGILARVRREIQNDDNLGELRYVRRISVQEFVSTCQICQKDKWETLQPAGLMQPLSVPTKIWADILMDFVDALPKVSGKTVILVVVDRFSKYVHSIALSHPYTAVFVAQDFFRDIV